MNTLIKKEENLPLPPLVKGSSTYKLIVPEKVEEKIRYLIRKFPHTEWSGVLFCSHKGTFENNDLVITCEDIYPMDLGTSGWTEFKMSEDVAAYMAEHIELFDCSIQLVHSHHTLGAFLSGQDMKMVQQEGNDTNCFVSLVVDTKGTYVAIVTRKIQTKSEVTIKNLGKSYEFFGEGSRELTHDNTETTKVIDKTVIEYFDLEVERHEVPNTLDYLDARFEEIEQKKKENAPIRNMMQHKDSKTNEEMNFFDLLHQGNNFREPYLFENETKPRKDSQVSNNNSIWDWQPDPKKIHRAVVHILTCNLILDPTKIDLKQWVTRHMTNVYKRVFGEHSSYECENNASGAFSEWKDFILQHTIDYFDYNDVPDELMENNFDLVQSRIAQALIDEISEFVDVNPYITSYLKELYLYLVE